MDFYKEWLGIPEGPRPPDHYELLRLRKFEDDANRVRTNYKKLNGHVRKYATGQYSVQSQELLNEIAKAMLCLTDPERKRDYDESLGRVFETAKDDYGRQPFLDILMKQGKLTREQMREAEDFSSKRGLSDRDAVVQMKLVEPEPAAQALALHHGLSYVDLDDMTPEDDILDATPRSLVKRHTLIPLFIDDGRLMVACVDMPDHEVEDEMRLRYGVPMRAVLATPRAINQAVSKYYAPGMRDDAVTFAGAAATPAPMIKNGKAAAKTDKPEKAAKASSSKSHANARFADLPEDEKAKRKQIGLIAMSWSILLPAVAQYFLMPTSFLFGAIPWFALLTAPPVILYVTQKYWK
ncbi:MAG: general secretion pathway protein GspE [Planctomycetota bacterium]|nr:MAG: general secretion pathway protein GspE [Planctomycetota bacterium]